MISGVKVTKYKAVALWLLILLGVCRSQVCSAGCKCNLMGVVYTWLTLMVCLVEYVHLLNAAHIAQGHYYYYTAIRYKHLKQQYKLCEIVRLTGSKNANTNCK